MFPSLLALREDLTNSGTVFSVVLGRDAKSH